VTSRSIYRYLLRLHPARFRKQFEEQMQWIFDETVRSRGAVPLLFDAAVSLVRQWILRSRYWRHAKPTMAVDGTNALTEELHRNSQKLYRRAWWLNFLWMVWALIVLLMCPLPFFIKLQFAIVVTSAVSLLSGRKQHRVREWWPEYTSLFYYKNSREFYRTRIAAKRDSLRAWVGRSDGSGGAGGVLVAFSFLFALWIIRPIIRSYQGLPQAGLDWDHSRYFIYGLVALMFSWRFMRPLNERAAQAIQQEVDAMEDSSKPQSV